MPEETSFQDAATQIASGRQNVIKTGDVTSTSQQLETIGAFIKTHLPPPYNTKPYSEILKARFSDGSTGLDLIHAAWAEAVDDCHNILHTATDGAAFRKAVIDIATMSAGGGMFDYQLQNFMVGFDKFHASRLTPYIELAGPTFITRPRLCLQSSNLRNNEAMMPLDTADPNSVAFAVRWLLDSNLCSPPYIRSDEYRQAAAVCPLINTESPWLTPLCNAITSISGFPDFDLQTERTDGGYFSEAQSYATGQDAFSRAGYTINCNFRELPGGIIFSIFYYWLEYIRCVTRNIMLAYPDDIDGQIMNYTVSIYTFNLDPSQRYLTKWAKCTGCFPTTLNWSSIMDKSDSQFFQEASAKIGIPFICNKVEYMRPSVLLDFNLLAMRYCPKINVYSNGLYATQERDGTYDIKESLARESIPYSAFGNFCGLPFIVSDPHGYRLVYRATEHDMYSDPLVQKLIAYDVGQKEKIWAGTTTSAANRFTDFMDREYREFKAKADDMNAGTSPYQKKFEDIVADLMVRHNANPANVGATQ